MEIPGLRDLLVDVLINYENQIKFAVRCTTFSTMVHDYLFSAIVAASHRTTTALAFKSLLSAVNAAPFLISTLMNVACVGSSWRVHRGIKMVCSQSNST